MTALEADPYVLPLPSPDTPVVLEGLVVAMHAHLNGRYADREWPLAPLIGNPSSNLLTLSWDQCPEEFEDELRLISWIMINGELRPTFLKDRSTRLRARVSSSTLYLTILQWFALAKWLAGRGIYSLAECDSRMLHEYGERLRDSGRDRGYVQRLLGMITRLWAFDQLAARSAGIARPPWDQYGADDYLPAATRTSGGENETEILAEQTMGPLLVWAMRVVDDYADDILNAWSERERLAQAAVTNPATPEGWDALCAYIDPLIAAGAPIPSSNMFGENCLARNYLGGITGASKEQVERLCRRHDLPRIARQRPAPCPLDVAVTGEIAGRPWREMLDFNEAKPLLRHLGTACFIVLAYLTGMRPGEVLGLRSGCCPDPEPDANNKVGRHLIRGLVFKTATDEGGNHLSVGVEREVPWVAIAPVVNAIRVLERIVPVGHLLFDRNVHDTMGRTHTGSLKSSAIANRIDDFIKWANAEAATHNLLAEVIPPDPKGAVGTARFRRSLAWHIARRPGGLVALAIQYGHLRSRLVSEGYASRSRDGIHELIDVETARAVADTIIDLKEQLDEGSGVSGPAARRAIKTAATALRFEGTIITAKSARKLIANEDVMIYDNPHAMLLCHYRRDQALCHRDGVKDSPSLDHCVAGCGNIVRTDQHAAQLRARADVMDARATASPQPVADRLHSNATKLRALANNHDHTRIALDRKDIA